MSASRTKFYRNKQDAKWLGVCAGIADYTGIDATFVRIAFVLSIFLSQGITFFAYIIAAFVAEKKPAGLYNGPEDEKFWQGVRQSPARSTRDVRAKFREIDRRLADVELYYTSRNTRLSDEIDALR